MLLSSLYRVLQDNLSHQIFCSNFAGRSAEVAGYRPQSTAHWVKLTPSISHKASKKNLTIASSKTCNDYVLYIVPNLWDSPFYSSISYSSLPTQTNIFGASSQQGHRNFARFFLSEVFCQGKITTPHHVKFILHHLFGV